MALKRHTIYTIILSIILIASEGFGDSLALININDNNTLSWKLANITAGNQSNVSSSFGSAGDHIILGSFTGINSTDLGIITVKENGNDAVWKLINSSGKQIKSLKFGNEKSLFVAGADFDNNGVIDPTFVNERGRGLKWTIKLNGLTNSFIDLSRKHGKAKFFKTAMFVNFYGNGDWAGVITRKRSGASTLILKHPFGNEKRTVSLGKLSLETKRPLPIKSNSGIDILAIPEGIDGQTKVTFINSLGENIGTRTFGGTETIVVGNFNASEPGEEIAIQNGDKLMSYNPFTKIAKAFSIPNSIIVDQININTFGSDNSDGGSGGGTCPGGTPGICGCRFLDETDGYKTGFVYKRKSDTYGGIVMVLPNPCGRETTGMVTMDTDCNEIHRLTYTGMHNPDSTGERAHFKEVDARYDGYWYKSNYGSIILKMEGAGTCFMIADPAAERVD